MVLGESEVQRLFSSLDRINDRVDNLIERIFTGEDCLVKELSEHSRLIAEVKKDVKLPYQFIAVVALILGALASLIAIYSIFIN